MADAGRILERIRAVGANVVIDDGKLLVVNRDKLPAGALDFIQRHSKEITSFLCREGEVEERAAIIQFDGHAPREWAEQFAKILTDRRPQGVNDVDWSWFITRCGQIVDAAPTRAVA